jgi:histidyl-tRNA synthetase
MFENLPGFRDFYPDACIIRNHLFALWKQTAFCFGFSEYDVPILEPLELFTKKSGEQVVNQLFSFTDKGNRSVALRPEITPSVARLVGARANSLKRPIKWFNVGEHFRYEKPQKGRTRSFYQFNADIFGSNGSEADAELIALCIESLKVFGLTADHFQVRLSDRTLWFYYLQALGIQQSRLIPILSIIDQLARDRAEVTIKKLEPDFGNTASDFYKKINELTQLYALEDIRSFMLSQTHESKIAEKINKRIAEWECLLETLEAMALLPFLKIDLGIVRGLAYYTGFVFEAFEKTGKSRALAGGGRYDSLTKLLGYADIPACGFGMGDVTLTDLLKEKNLLPQSMNPLDFYIVIMGDTPERKLALADIAKLRRLGFRVEYSLKKQNFNKQFKAANHSGARAALIYGTEETASKTVKVRNLTTGKEIKVDSSKLTTTLKNREIDI